MIFKIKNPLARGLVGTAILLWAIIFGLAVIYVIGHLFLPIFVQIFPDTNYLSEAEASWAFLGLRIFIGGIFLLVGYLAFWFFYGCYWIGKWLFKKEERSSDPKLMDKTIL